MKQLLLFIVFCLPFIALAHDGRGCNTDSYTEWLWRKNPGLKEKMERENAALAEEMHKRSVIEKRQTIYTIPVVVHIVYKDAATNLPYNKIYDQIVRLNKDYRRVNDDRNNTLSQFQPVAADARIQFVFADTDPNGQPTTGITRTSTAVTEFAGPSDPGFNNSCQKAINGGIDVWDPTRYMNIWVCLLSGTTLGYAQLPGGPSTTDGIVIDTAYFGASPGNGAYDLGRTLTHESGHWFNLQHTWGPGTGSCAQDDGVSDTPNTDQAHYGCPLNTVACTELSMVQNYMDYTDDDCMNIFTQGQTDRMRAELTGAGRRTVLPLSGYSGVIPGINDNYTDPFSTTGDTLTGGGSSSDNLIGNFLGFEIPGIGPWGTLAVIIAGGVLVIVFLAACLGCLCCGGGGD